MQRTIRILLEPSPAQADALAETSRQFTLVFNAVCAHGWQQREKNGVELHRALYYPLKADYPHLVSDLHVQARVKATESIKSALARAKMGRKVSQPHSDTCPPHYNLHTFRVDWESQTVNLSTSSGRQTIRFTLPAYEAKYAHCLTDTADLLFRTGSWWMHVVVTVPAPEVEPTEQIVGVDLGLARPAVTSAGRFLGQRAWKAIEGRLFHLRRKLQQKGTRSAKRHLRRLRRKQARFRRDCDHHLSRRIVESVQPGGTVVLENLKDIRRRVKARRKTENARRLHSWSFAQLKSFLEYKAEERGLTVVGVDPRHTSQACSRCGHTARTSRRSRGWFCCQVCGFSVHADLNAARNIAAKYHAGGGKAAAGGRPVNPPIVSAPALRRLE